MDFKTFISESEEKHATLAFVRMNPIHKGHELLLNKVHSVSKEKGGDAHVVASHTEGNAKNPIPHKKKLEYIKKVAKPGTRVSGSSKEAPSILHHASKLHSQGYTHLHIVGDRPRAESFHKMLNTYNGKKGLRHGHYNFKNITKHIAGERSDDAKGVEGMSGTKMRAHARSGDMKSFKAGLPKALHPHADEIANHIRSVKEEYKYEWGTPEGTAFMKSMTPGEKKDKKTKTVVEVQHMHDKVRQDPDIKKRSGTQPAKYHSGLSKSTKEKRDAQFKRQAKMDDSNPAAYKPAPGDKGAKTKPSKHTIAYRKKFGESNQVPILLMNKNQINEKFGEEEMIDLEEAKGLAKKAKDSGISIGTLRKVYNRGMAAWRTGHRPGTTPQQWAMARVNSYINKGKGTYHGADKDLREETKMNEEDLEKLANDLKWEDIVDFYKDDELQKEDTLVSEALSAQARIKKRQTFARFRGKRGIAKGLKLRRASDMNTLKRRARLAARRALYSRFLRGRNKAKLSPAEKDRLEKQVATLKTLQTSLAQKMLPKIRGIEQKRLAGYRTKKR